MCIEERPMSDLYESIIVKGYNENKVFQPILDLARLKYESDRIYALTLDDDHRVLCIIDESNQDIDLYTFPFKFHDYLEVYWYKFNIEQISIEEKELLIQWGFLIQKDIKESILANTIPLNLEKSGGKEKKMRRKIKDISLLLQRHLDRHLAWYGLVTCFYFQFIFIPCIFGLISDSGHNTIARIIIMMVIIDLSELTLDILDIIRGTKNKD